MRRLGHGLIMVLCATGAMTEDWRAVPNAFDRDPLDRHGVGFGKAMQIAMRRGRVAISKRSRACWRPRRSLFGPDQFAMNFNRP